MTMTTLFAALSGRNGKLDNSDDSNNDNLEFSSSPPQAIQLYSHDLFDFLSGSIVNVSSNDPLLETTKREDGVTDGHESVANAEIHPTRQFSILSYQAVQTLQEDDDDEPQQAMTGRLKKNRMHVHVRPDLGIWDCRVVPVPSISKKRDMSSTAMVQKQETHYSMDDERDSHQFSVEALGKMLNRVLLDYTEGDEEKKDDGMAVSVPFDMNRTKTIGNRYEVKTVVCTINIKEPSQVQTLMERMRKVVLNIYDNVIIQENGGNEALNDGVKNKKKGAYATTSLQTLKSCPFGESFIKKDIQPVSTLDSSVSSESKSIALILAVIVAAPEAKNYIDPVEEYKERQARSLVLYHLHKFASEVNCTLCFVSAKKEINVETFENPSVGTRSTALSVDELGTLIRRVSMGLPPVDSKHENFLSIEDAAVQDLSSENHQNIVDVVPTMSEAVYEPGLHDSELIFGAMLRNASCEGLWDASKDDLNTALSPPRASAAATGSDTSDTIVAGDSTDDAAAMTLQQGDEEWLSKLASSVGLTHIDNVASSSIPSGSEDGDMADNTKTLTPADRKKEMMKKKKSSKNIVSSSNLEKDPSDFFANLLKK